MSAGRPRPGSREWQRQFDADRARMDRFHRWWFPLCVVASIVGAVTVIVLVALGKIPLWVLFV